MSELKKIQIGQPAPAMPGTDAPSEEKDVQLIDQAIEQIKGGDSEGAIATLGILKGNEQGEASEEGAEPAEPSLNDKFAAHLASKMPKPAA